MQFVVCAAQKLRTPCSKTVLLLLYLFNVSILYYYMYAYEVQCEEEFVNSFYRTVNKFLD